VTSRREGGIALVEFALVAPMLVLLLFGSVEFGIAFSDLQSIRQGARDGARAAVVDNVPNCTSASGTDDTDDLICYVEQRIGINGDIRVKVDVTAPDTANPVDRGSIKICVERQLTSMTGVLTPFIAGRVLRTEVTMRVERGTAPAFVDRAEAPVTGAWTC
jgi:hypothetical protein